MIAVSLAYFIMDSINNYSECMNVLCISYFFQLQHIVLNTCNSGSWPASITGGSHVQVGYCLNPAYICAFFTRSSGFPATPKIFAFDPEDHVGDIGIRLKMICYPN